MTITCPHCGFSRDVEEAKVPARPVRVTCPRCLESFALERNEFQEQASETQADEAGAFEPREPFSAPEGGKPALPSAALPKAGFWVRVVAWAIDSIVVSMVQGVLTLFLGIATGGLVAGLGMEGEIMMAVVFLFFGMVLSWTYYVFFTGYCGQTPGKMAVRVKVIRTDGGEIGFGRAFLREIVGKFVSTALLGIGYLMIAFDEQKQGLHDRIADTFVIKL